MKFSYNWLQEYFYKPLPSPRELADLLTFHSFEIEGLEDFEDDVLLNIDVLPNRTHDCLSYFGMASEISLLLDTNFKNFKQKQRMQTEGVTQRSFRVDVRTRSCRRYMGRIFENVKVQPSPEWLVTKLRAMGQRSINNVVDITNFVMFETGQPLHAFDLDRVKLAEHRAIFTVRDADEEEKFVSLDGKEFILDSGMTVIADAEGILAVGGVKGGINSQVTEKTKNILVEAANFDPTSVRSTSRKLQLQTESSYRFEQDISCSLAPEALEYTSRLLSEHASFTNFVFGEAVDFERRKENAVKIAVHVPKMNSLLGTSFSQDEFEAILRRFRFQSVVALPARYASENAATYENTPYLENAGVSDAPDYFSNSSFIAFLFREQGLYTPETMSELFAWSEAVEEDEVRPGDMFFFEDIAPHEEKSSKKKEKSPQLNELRFLEDEKKGSVPRGCGIFLGSEKRKRNVAYASPSAQRVVVETIEESSLLREQTLHFRSIPGSHEECTVVSAPLSRLDLIKDADIFEEIGRVYGYEKISLHTPSFLSHTSKYPAQLRIADTVRDILVREGFSEIMTSSFTKNGDVLLENPLALDREYLRAGLTGGVLDALSRNKHYCELLQRKNIKIFEIGKIYSKSRELSSLAIGVFNPIKGAGAKELGRIHSLLENNSSLSLQSKNIDGGVYEYVIEAKETEDLIENEDIELLKSRPLSSISNKYAPISPYPFLVRDLAIFVPGDIEYGVVKEEIIKQAQTFRPSAGADKEGLLRTVTLFDIYKKTNDDGEYEVSYAFRLVFQSHERTLSDEEISKIMDFVNQALMAHEGWRVR